MAWNGCICTIACVVLAGSGGVSRAQTSLPSDAWLMKNYHFTGPPPPSSIVPTDPVVSELRQIQNTILSIMRKADFGEDYETALVAAGQAAANAQLIGTITERLEAAKAAKAVVAEEPKPDTPIYAIALKDHSVHFATAYWTDRFMLHYMTRQGSHVQIRLDLVDVDVSTRLNREKNLEFRLHE